MQNHPILAREERGVFPVLRGPHRADAVVVGGGLTGLTTALWLRRAGLRVALLEAHTLGCGSSAHCAGMVSLTGSIMLDALQKQRGAAVAEAYMHSRLAAFGALRTLALSAGDGLGWQDVDCHLLPGGTEKTLTAEAAQLNRCGVAAQVSRNARVPIPAPAVLTLPNMACLHPGRYFAHLVRAAADAGVAIYEHSRVVALETNLAQTQQGAVEAPCVVVATGYPLVNVPGWYFLRLKQRRRCLVTVSGRELPRAMLWNGNGRFGFRRWQEGLLAQVDGGMVGFGREKSGRQRYRQLLGRWLGEAEAWQEGLETFSADGLPYIGPYSTQTPNLFVATGYGGHGLLGSITAAQLISARVLGLPAEGAYVFSGQRNDPASLGRAALSSLATAGRYLGATWRVLAPRCPHMGCRMVYSRCRHLWECPCHGSCFDDVGHLLNAPAAEDAAVNRRR